MQNIKFAKTALAAIVVMTTAVMLIGGLTLIPPFEEAQAVKEDKDKQKNNSWYCFSYEFHPPDGSTGTATVCEETMEQCQSSTFAFDVVEGCHEEKKPPAGAVCPSPGEEGTYNPCGKK